MYLSWKAKQNGLETPLIDQADKTNRQMPEYVVSRLTELLNADRTPLAGADVHILGVAYKPDVPDIRKSPALEIIELLEGYDVTVNYSDPYIPSIDIESIGFYESEPPVERRLAETDCVLLVTDHSAFDLRRIGEAAPLVFDTRNAMPKHLDSVHVL